MVLILKVAAAIIAIVCLIYLLLSPMEKHTYFPSRFVGKLLFPKLGRFERLKRLTYLAGIILFTIFVTATISLVFKLASRTH